MKGASARDRAAKALSRVWEDAAFAAAVLDAELAAEPKLDPRDAALATELVYGVLRTQGFLDARVAELAKRGRAFDEPIARAHLLIGLYSIAFLEKVPAFAAVSEAVSAVRERIGERPAAFVNGVLRSYQRAVEASGRPDLARALIDGAPGWLRGALRRSLGRKDAESFLAAGTEPAALGLALAEPSERATWMAKLHEAAPLARVEEGRWSPHAINMHKSGPVHALPGHESAWIVNEEGAQIVALALGVRRGDAVLDACAGRGNKTWLLRRYTSDLVAADKHPAKLERLSHRVPGVATVALDLTIGAGDLARRFDRVLVDAPCSGSGTLRKHPEIALHRDASSVAALTDTQIAITRTAATLLKPGGRLVYAVCSVLQEECEAVVEALSQTKETGIEPAPFDRDDLPCASGATSFRLLPHVHGTDGYFVASFRSNGL